MKSPDCKQRSADSGTTDRPDDWRTFRLDRITHPAATGARATRTEVPGHDPAAFLEARSLEATPVFVADVIIDAVRDDLHRWSASSGGSLTDLPAGQCHWQSAPDTLDWLTMNLVRLHRPFTIETPVALADHVAAVAARLEGNRARRTAQKRERFARSSTEHLRPGVRHSTPARRNTTTPPTINAMPSARSAVAGSPRASTPTSAAPTVPMPVQIA